MPDPQAAARVAAAARHVKRATGQLRTAGRELAQAADLDTVAHIVVRTPQDAQQAQQVLELALTEHNELDVLLIAAPNPTTAAKAQETP